MRTYSDRQKLGTLWKVAIIDIKKFVSKFYELLTRVQGYNAEFLIELVLHI